MNKTSDKVAVDLVNIGKKYRLDHRGPSLLENITGKHKTENFWALKSINLKITKGENIGIVGPNGSGKTTLLKIISGITAPSTGKIQVNGKIVSLMNLEAGFHPDLTGEENIYLNGLLIGMSKDEIRTKYSEIIKFADIGKFIDAPFYTYSDGMKFRLAFAVASASSCDILVLDEVFVSGDIDFQKKSFSAIEDLQKNKGVTTIICSHVAVLVQSFANSYYMLRKGTIKKISHDQMKRYTDMQNKQWAKNVRKKS